MLLRSRMLLRSGMRLLPRWRLVVLLWWAALVPVGIAISLIVVGIAVVPDIRRVVLLRWRKGTVAIIRSPLIRIARVRVAVARVYARLSRRHGSTMVFPAGCPRRHGRTVAEITRPCRGRDPRAPMIRGGEILAVSRSGTFMLALNIQLSTVSLA